MATYPVLQSGFVGFDVNGYMLPDPTEPTPRQSIMYREYREPLTNYYFSKEVSEMYAKWSADPKVISQFEYRERLIKLVYTYFGKFFFRWLEIQTNTNALSALHGKFILETLEYVLNNVPRRIQNVQWISLLIAEETSKVIPVKLDEFLKLRPGSNRTTTIPTDMTEMIQAWTSKRDGFEDMMICMFVIFGCRGGLRSVSDDNIAR